MKPRILDLGDTALTLELGDRVGLALNARVLASRDALGKLRGITDVVPTYRSLTVHFDPAIVDREEVVAKLTHAAESSFSREASLDTTGAQWRIPVLFGGTHGPDLAAVARIAERSEDAVVEALCSLQLRVFMIGFLPGFPYLGELPEWLRLPRLSTPRNAVPPHSVAIAGAQAAIYPWSSPGGWHLIGQTPLRMFDLAVPERPALLVAGDTVRFVPVNLDEFARLTSAEEAGQLRREQFFTS